jgi:hypothetical protein
MTSQPQGVVADIWLGSIAHRISVDMLGPISADPPDSLDPRIPSIARRRITETLGDLAGSLRWH